jgi:two-component system NtrC family sensor kinase
MEPELDRLREELEIANRKLAEAHKMASLGRLSAGIVHEINTPIGSIFSNNEVILRSLEKVRGLLKEAIDAGTAPPQKSLDILEIITGLNEVDKLACERISGVIRSLKTLARVSGQEVRKTDVNELIGHTLKLARTVFRQRVTFELEPADVPEVECYPGLLGQVLLNLIVNGAQAIEEEGRIVVRTALEDDGIRISVSDTGRGIRPEDQGRIFQAGFSTKPIGEGTGIGLSLSREIIEDTHGGSIRFESEPGRGTTFHIRIPLRQTKGQ